MFRRCMCLQRGSSMSERWCQYQLGNCLSLGMVRVICDNALLGLGWVDEYIRIK